MDRAARVAGLPEASQVSIFYAGIGSRSTSADVLDYMARLAARLAARGFILRSGAADGADAAFESGCDQAGGQCEIWLPWRGFNKHADTGLYPCDYHYAQASLVHPGWNGMKQAVRSLHARNSGQVLGHDGSELSSFVVCWTQDGCESAAERTKGTGGTGQAIALASRYNVPVFNLAREGAKERLNDKVLDLLERERVRSERQAG